MAIQTHKRQPKWKNFEFISVFLRAPWRSIEIIRFTTIPSLFPTDWFKTQFKNFQTELHTCERDKLPNVHQNQKYYVTFSRHSSVFNLILQIRQWLCKCIQYNYILTLITIIKYNLMRNYLLVFISLVAK